MITTEEDVAFDVAKKHNKEALKPNLTPSFLKTLVQAGRTCGWSVDYVEVRQFIEWCYEMAGVELPANTEPFVSYSFDEVVTNDRSQP